MDPASQALAQDLPPGVRRSCSALAKHHGNVSRTTVYYRKKGRRSKQAKAQAQQYLSPSEEKALVDFLVRMGACGSPVRIKYIPSLAFCIARRRLTKRALAPPKKNWP